MCCRLFFVSSYFSLYYWGLFVFRIVIVRLICLNIYSFKFDIELVVFRFNIKNNKNDKIFLYVKLIKCKIREIFKYVRCWIDNE